MVGFRFIDTCAYFTSDLRIVNDELFKFKLRSSDFRLPTGVTNEALVAESKIYLHQCTLGKATPLDNPFANGDIMAAANAFLGTYFANMFSKSHEEMRSEQYKKRRYNIEQAYETREDAQAAWIALLAPKRCNRGSGETTGGVDSVNAVAAGNIAKTGATASSSSKVPEPATSTIPTRLNYVLPSPAETTFTYTDKRFSLGMKARIEGPADGRSGDCDSILRFANLENLQDDLPAAGAASIVLDYHALDELPQMDVSYVHVDTDETLGQRITNAGNASWFHEFLQCFRVVSAISKLVGCQLMNHFWQYTIHFRSIFTLRCQCEEGSTITLYTWSQAECDRLLGSLLVPVLWETSCDILTTLFR